MQRIIIYYDSRRRRRVGGGVRLNNNRIVVFTIITTTNDVVPCVERRSCSVGAVRVRPACGLRVRVSAAAAASLLATVVARHPLS